jgi:hypothetical protein
MIIEAFIVYLLQCGWLLDCAGAATSATGRGNTGAGTGALAAAMNDSTTAKGL